MNACIYDKTDKGREEIATRKYRVAPRLRALLVMIDGQRPLDFLLENYAGLGVNQASVDELLDDGYITLVSGAEEAGLPEQPSPDPAQASATVPASARARMLARRRLASGQAGAGVT